MAKGKKPSGCPLKAAMAVMAIVGWWCLISLPSGVELATESDPAVDGKLARETDDGGDAAQPIEEVSHEAEVAVEPPPRPDVIKLPPRPSVATAASTAGRAAPSKDRWSSAQIIKYMQDHNSRAYFAHLFSKGGFKNGVEVGVADGRFSEHMLIAARPSHWTMVEPFPNEALISRYPPAGEGELNEQQKAYRADRADQKKELAESWHKRGIDKGIKLELLRHFSTDKEVINAIPKGTVDFIYLDGAHDYKNVKKELEPYWKMLAVGGILAGHDYQNHGEKPLGCKGCDNIPKARQYTEAGIKHGKKAGAIAADMNKVVKAVQEWVSEEHPNVELHHTLENFSKESLEADGLDYDLVITNTYNPSWFFIKAET